MERVAASCVWLASKLEESPRKARQVLIVFHRMECRRENLPVEHLDLYSKKYSELKMDLIRTERHLLKEMGFICHVEHPHKFISNYLAVLELKEPSELRPTFKLEVPYQMFNRIHGNRKHHIELLTKGNHVKSAPPTLPSEPLATRGTSSQAASKITYR